MRGYPNNVLLVRKVQVASVKRLPKFGTLVDERPINDANGGQNDSKSNHDSGSKT